MIDGSLRVLHLAVSHIADIDGQFDANATGWLIRGLSRIEENRLNRLIICLAALGIAAGATSCVHSPNSTSLGTDAERLRPRWTALDANRDGSVMLAELHPMLSGTMKGNDLDGDGAISLAEYVVYDLDPGGSGRIPLSDNVQLISDVPYAATTDPRQRLDIYLPKKATVPGPLPVIAYVHGGAWSVGSKVMARSQVMKLVDSGRYAAVSIGYRLSWQEKWPRQMDDIKAGIRWIRGNAAEYGFDPNRICASGSSAGGHLVAMLGLTNGNVGWEGILGRHRDQSSKVRCVIDLFGPADFRAKSGPALQEAVAALLGSQPAESPQAADSASPLLHVDPSDPPFLIIHGTKDPLVPYQESVDLDKALRAQGVPVIFQTIEGGGHGNFGSASIEVERRIAAFLERNFYDATVQVPSNTLSH